MNFYGGFYSQLWGGFFGRLRRDGVRFVQAAIGDIIEAAKRAGAILPTPAEDLAAASTATASASYDNAIQAKPRHGAIIS